ncbi:MAG: pentapeptide repeat-containing protein [Syntrophobacteraceae bacterium]
MVMVYMLLIIASTTDRQLLTPESKVILPIFNVEVSLTSFFSYAPLIVLVMHLNFLFNLRQHSRRLVQWYKLARKDADESEEELSDALTSPFLLNFIIDNEVERAKKSSNVKRNITFYKCIFSIIVYIMPVVILFMIQYGYSKYHSLGMTLWHSAIVFINIILASVFWKNITDVPSLYEETTCRPAATSTGSASGKPETSSFRSRVKSLWPRTRHVVGLGVGSLKCHMKRLGLFHSSLIITALILQICFNSLLWSLLSIAGKEFNHFPSLTRYIQTVTPHLNVSEQTLVASSPGDQVMQWYLTAEKEKSKRSAQGGARRFWITEDVLWTLRQLGISEKFLEKTDMEQMQVIESDEKSRAVLEQQIEANMIHDISRIEFINNLTQRCMDENKNEIQITNQIIDKMWMDRKINFPYIYYYCAYLMMHSTYDCSNNEKVQGAFYKKYKEELGELFKRILRPKLVVNESYESYWTNKSFKFKKEDFERLRNEGNLSESIKSQLGRLKNKKLRGVEELQRETLAVGEKESPKYFYLLLKIATDSDPSVSRPSLPPVRPSGGAPAEDNDRELAKRATENAWRDFGSGMNLQGRDLRFADFSKTNLRKADLRSANLQGCNFEGAQLQGAKLDKAHLEGANLRRAQLQDATLGEAELIGATLEDASLERASLQKANLRGSDLNQAQMTGAYLDGANLDGAILWRAQAKDAHITEVSAKGADLEEANLVRANLNKSRMQACDLKKADLSEAKLEEAQLAGARIEGARLRDAKMKRAQLQSVILDRAELVDADLGGVELHNSLLIRTALQGADLSGAHLLGVTLTYEQVEDLVDFSQEEASILGAVVQPVVSEERKGENFTNYEKFLNVRKELACTDKHVAKGIWRQLLFDKSDEEGRRAIAQHMESTCPALWKTIQW